MKARHLLFFTIFASFGTLTKAQGNLQFNQILSYSGHIENYNMYAASPIWTVPTGKVWKIENYAKDYFYVKGFAITANTNLGPIWLRAGDEINYTPPVAAMTGYNYILSIIEFNVVP